MRCLQLIILLCLFLSFCRNLDASGGQQMKHYQTEANMLKNRKAYFPNGCVSNQFYPQSITAGVSNNADESRKRIEEWKIRKKALIQEYIDKNKAVDMKIKDHLLNLEVCEGMTKEQVRLIWDDLGIKKYLDIPVFGATEKWEYHVIWYVLHLYFGGDNLVRIIPYNTDIMP